MNIFKTAGDAPVKSNWDIALSLKGSMEDATAIRGNASLGKSLLAGESLDGVQAGTTFQETCVQAFTNSGLVDMVMKRFNTTDKEHPMVVASLNNAAGTFAAITDPNAFRNNSLSTVDNSAIKAKVLDYTVPGIELAGSLGGESFEKIKIEDQLHVATVVSALATTVNSFAQLFFPTVTLPAGKSGVDISVRSPYAYSMKKRNADGSAYNERDHRKPLVAAYSDYNILKSLNGRVFPRATSPTLPAGLVPASKVPSASKEVQGHTFDSRPIMFGKQVDLIAISHIPEIHGANTGDQTDELDRNVLLGEVFIEFDDGTNSTVIEFDISSLPGANFTNVSEGEVTTRSINFTGVVSLKEDLTDVNGADLNSVAFRTSGGVGATDAWDALVEIEISGSIDELNNIRLHAPRAEFTRFRDQAVNVSDSTLGTVKNNISIASVAYYPRTARTNSNLKDRGRIINAGVPKTYRIPVLPSSPLTSISPIGEQGEIDLADLSNAKMVIDTNNATATILDFENMISRTRDLPSNSTAVGSLLVNPYWVKANIDLDNDLRIHSSMNGMSDLRYGLSDALSIMADQMAMRSGYLAVLELESGSQDNYEVILGTSPHLANLIMTGGDARTGGAKTRFNVGVSHDKVFHDKIYMSFRRTDVSGPNALSFGFHAEAPPVIYNAPISTNDANISQLQLISRNIHAVTLPILGVMEVENLKTVFYTETT